MVCSTYHNFFLEHPENHISQPLDWNSVTEAWPLIYGSGRAISLGQSFFRPLGGSIIGWREPGTTPHPLTGDRKDTATSQHSFMRRSELSLTKPGPQGSLFTAPSVTFFLETSSLFLENNLWQVSSSAFNT